MDQGLAALGTFLDQGLPALGHLLYPGLTALGPKMDLGLAAPGTKMYPGQPSPGTRGHAKFGVKFVCVCNFLLTLDGRPFQLSDTYTRYSRYRYLVILKLKQCS